jgi:hypothetical protein
MFGENMNAASLLVRFSNAESLRSTWMPTAIRAILTFVFAALSLCATSASGQTSAQIGLPVLFVHGVCDTPDNFSAAEIAVKNSLEGQFPALYPKLSSLTSPLPEEYVAFYNGSEVVFQVPGTPSKSNTTTTQIDARTRFFLADFNDGLPGDKLYQEFDQNAPSVAQISILHKAQELAHIVWAIKAATFAPRVIVVGHSMGGLVSRAYIEGLSIPSGSLDQPAPYFNDIASLVTLDTPHGGLAEAAWPSLLSVSSPNECALGTSLNKAEMTPSGPGSLISLLNYHDPSSKTQPAPLPRALGITSIASHWQAPGNDLVLAPQVAILSTATQDLKANLKAPATHAFSTMELIDNSFESTYMGKGSSHVKCRAGAELLHSLDCTGSNSQTFARIENGISATYAPIADSRLMQVTPGEWNVAPGETARFSTITPSGAPAIWSIREGAAGGAIDSASGRYQAPAVVEGGAATFHVVAIDSKLWTEYAEATVLVSSNSSSGVITTLPATLVTSNGGTLNGTVNPEGSAGYAFLRWTTDPKFTNPYVACPGNSPRNCPALIANHTAQPISAPLKGLDSSTIIYYQAAFLNTASNSYQYGAIRSFTPLLPIETATAATLITSNGGTLNGTVNPEGSPGYAFLRWTTDPKFTNPYVACPGNDIRNCALVNANYTAQSISAPLKGLDSNATIYYQAAFRNTANGSYQYGAIRSFTTVLPIETATGVTSLTSSGGTLNGTVNTKGSPGYVYFQWATDSKFTDLYIACPGNDVRNCPLVKASSTAQPISTPLPGLASNTTFYYRAAFRNTANGSYNYGAIQSFKTLLPVETAMAATAITSKGGTMNGTVNPKGSAGYAYFLWGWDPKSIGNIACRGSAPSYCAALNANFIAQQVSTPLTGLGPNATIYYVAAFYNSANHSYQYSSILSFTTLAK